MKVPESPSLEQQLETERSQICGRRVDLADLFNHSPALLIPAAVFSLISVAAEIERKRSFPTSEGRFP
jgi:hypothetical protein